MQPVAVLAFSIGQIIRRNRMIGVFDWQVVTVAANRVLGNGHVGEAEIR